LSPRGGSTGPTCREAGAHCPGGLENVAFNLAATRPDLLIGVDPATGAPAPYGSVGTDINCTVIGFTGQGPHRQPRHPRP